MPPREPRRLEPLIKSGQDDPAAIEQQVASNTATEVQEPIELYKKSDPIVTAALSVFNDLISYKYNINSYRRDAAIIKAAKDVTENYYSCSKSVRDDVQFCLKPLKVLVDGEFTKLSYANLRGSELEIALLELLKLKE